MTYKVVTSIEKIPFIVKKQMRMRDRIIFRTMNLKQNEIFRFVCKYFGQANDTWKDILKEINNNENQIVIEYDAKDYDDALQEHTNIKENAFKSLGSSEIKRFKSMFKVSSQIKDTDPQFEKLCNFLLTFNIMLQVEIKQETIND